MSSTNKNTNSKSLRALRQTSFYAPLPRNSRPANVVTTPIIPTQMTARYALAPLRRAMLTANVWQQVRMRRAAKRQREEQRLLTALGRTLSDVVAGHTFNTTPQHALGPLGRCSAITLTVVSF